MNDDHQHQHPRTTPSTDDSMSSSSADASLPSVTSPTASSISSTSSSSNDSTGNAADAAANTYEHHGDGEGDRDRDDENKDGTSAIETADTATNEGYDLASSNDPMYENVMSQLEDTFQRKLHMLDMDYKTTIHAHRFQLQHSIEAASNSVDTMEDPFMRHINPMSLGYASLDDIPQHNVQDLLDDFQHDNDDDADEWTTFDSAASSQNTNNNNNNNTSSTASASTVTSTANTSPSSSSTSASTPASELNSDKIDRIKHYASSIKLTHPRWATGMNEDEWMSKILKKNAYMVPNAAATAHSSATNETTKRSNKSNSDARPRKTQSESSSTDWASFD
jgi:hypothetical protein